MVPEAALDPSDHEWILEFDSKNGLHSSLGLGPLALVANDINFTDMPLAPIFPED